MKKLSILFLSVLVWGFLFGSCGKDETISKSRERNVEAEILQKFEYNLFASEAHSRGLDYVYERLEGYTEKGFRSLNKDVLDYYAKAVQDIAHEYAISQGEKSADLSLESSNAIISMVEFNRKSEDLRAVPIVANIESKNTPIEVLAFLDALEQQISISMTVDSVKEVVKGMLLSEQVLSYSPEMQEILSITGAVYVDSYRYWSRNLEKWVNRLQGQEDQLRGLWDKMKKAFINVASDDAEAAAQAAITTAVVAATGVGVSGAAGAIAVSAVVGSAWGATSRAIGKGMVMKAPLGEEEGLISESEEGDE